MQQYSTLIRARSGKIPLVTVSSWSPFVLVEQKIYGTADESIILSVILLSTCILSILITIMGIKLRWFRRRLTFDQPEAQITSPVIMRTTSMTEIRVNCARGVYRQSTDSENIDNFSSSQITVANGTSVAKTKNSDRQSIFKLPFKSKLTTSKNAEKNNVARNQAASGNSVHPPYTERDIAIMQKNENLKRMIHEKLQTTKSTSLPDLSRESSIQIRIEEPIEEDFYERSVEEEDRVDRNQAVVSSSNNQPETIFAKVKKPAPKPPVEEASNELSIKAPPRKLISEESFQRKVKFEEVNEVEQMEVIETIEEDQLELDEKMSQHATDEASEIFEEYRHELPPPTPMKRKSTEDNEMSSYFVEHEDYENEVEVEDDQKINEKIPSPPVAKPRVKKSPRNSDIEENAREAIEIRTSQQNYEEVDDLNKKNLDPVANGQLKISFDGRQEVIDFSRTDSEESQESVEQRFQRVDLETDTMKIAEYSNEPISMEIVPKITHEIDTQPYPKSILKTTDNFGSPKKITFRSSPETIYDNKNDISSSSSDSEDEDIWNQVDRHRYLLTRFDEKIPELPPPLPKTPPPSAEEEKKAFSYA